MKLVHKLQLSSYSTIFTFRIQRLKGMDFFILRLLVCKILALLIGKTNELSFNGIMLKLDTYGLVKSFLLASGVFVMGPVHSSANAHKRSLAHALFSANRYYIEDDRLKIYSTHWEVEHWLKCCYMPFYFDSTYNLMQENLLANLTLTSEAGFSN